MFMHLWGIEIYKNVQNAYNMQKHLHTGTLSKLFFAPFSEKYFNFYPIGCYFYKLI